MKRRGYLFPKPSYDTEQERKQVPLELRPMEAAREVEVRDGTADLVALSSGS